MMNKKCFYSVPDSDESMQAFMYEHKENVSCEMSIVRNKGNDQWRQRFIAA
jgi:hypothetical protein